MRIILSGATGAMGKKIQEQVEKSETDNIVYVFSRANAISQNLEGDVMIDFSHPENLSALLDAARENNIPLLICTTGFSDEDIQRIKAERDIPVALVSNTSLGIRALKDTLPIIFNRMIDSDVSIHEIHHNKKKDAPSGTAKSIAKDLLSMGLEAQISSARLSDVVGEHRVMFSLEGESLELIHRATTKDVFAKGAIVLARKLMTKSRGFYTEKELMED